MQSTSNSNFLLIAYGHSEMLFTQCGINPYRCNNFRFGSGAKTVEHTAQTNVRPYVEKEKIKDIIKKIPIIGSVSRKIYGALYMQKPFPGSEAYWIQRYNSGGNSGAGSLHRLGEFKAEIINEFVKDNDIKTIIEFGCGDGTQLKLAEYPSLIGFDVSPAAIARCQDIFQYDGTKSFRLMTEYKGEIAQLTLSLDVIYHLVEEDIYCSYMKRLFNSSEQFVIIYSSDYNEKQRYHEKRRRFTEWVETNMPHWKLIRYIPNRFPYKDNKKGSLSDFYIYEKA